jgi:hypothetical protein
MTSNEGQAAVYVDPSHVCKTYKSVWNQTEHFPNPRWQVKARLLPALRAISRRLEMDQRVRSDGREWRSAASPLMTTCADGSVIDSVR